MTAMRQRVSIRVPEKFRGLRVASEITLLVLAIAPRPVGIPMPRGDLELGVLPVAHRTPAGRETFLDDRLRVEFVDRAVGQDVNRGAKGVVRPEGIGGMTLRRVDA